VVRYFQRVIDRQQAEQLALAWARRDSARLGYDCAPVVDEFDLGYVISSTVSTRAPTVPGDHPVTLVDRETGEVSSWPRLPSPVVQQMYRRDRARKPFILRTVDPATQLLREIRRLPTPGTAAHLTLAGETFVGRGAKGDVELRHHSLVRTYLDELPDGHLVRGGERHAELIVLSDTLHAQDHHRRATGAPPLTMEQAVDLLETARLEVFRVREPTDPAGGPAERPCDSCVNALVHFGVLPWPDLAFTREWLPPSEPSPEPGRFPAEVSDALVAGGWLPGPGDELLAHAAVEEVSQVSTAGRRHEVFDAAHATISAFSSLASGRRGPGRQVWISRFEIDPLHAVHSADTLADFGAVLGMRLFPIGSERGDSILAVDEAGRVFALDQAGEWFLGADIDAALTTLLLGRAPARVRDDGTW
jgi:hypothetical protein